MSELLLRGRLQSRQPQRNVVTTYDDLVASFDPNVVSYWKFDDDGATLIDQKGIQNGTISGSPERDVPTIVRRDTVAEGAPSDGTCIAWPGTIGEYAEVAHNSAHKTASGTGIVTHQHDSLTEKSTLVAAAVGGLAGGIVLEINPDGSPRATLRNASGVPVTLLGAPGNVQLNRAYTSFIKWGAGGFAYSLWNDAGALVFRSPPSTLTSGVTGTSAIRFGAWHSDVSFHDGPFARVIWMNRRLTDVEEATLAQADTIVREDDPGEEPPPEETEAQFWVSPTGTGSGTQTNPASIATAFAQARAGETWNFQAGTYLAPTQFQPVNSGTSLDVDGLITFRAEPGSERLAIIDGANPLGVIGKSFIKISGFKLQFSGGTLNQGVLVMGTSPASQGVIVDNCEIVGANDSAIYFKGFLNREQFRAGGEEIRLRNVIAENNLISGGGAGPNEIISIAFGVDGFEVRNNEIGNLEQIAIDAKAGVRNGRIWGNRFFGTISGPCIYLDAIAGLWVENIEVYNNWCAAGGASNGVVLAREDWDKLGGILRGIRIYNNVITGVGRDGIRLWHHPQDDTGLGVVTDIDIFNNTIYNSGIDPTHGGVAIRADHALQTDVVIRNNIVWQFQGTATQFSTVSQSNNLFNTTDPLFIDPSAGDFHLQSGSPARNAGSAAGAPIGAAKGFDGVSRPQETAWDIGAFEFVPGSSGTAPVAIDDTGFNVQTGGNTILVPVLANDLNVGASVSPVVVKTGGTTGPVITSVASNQLQVTSNASGTGAWSQSYEVTTDFGSDTAIASGTVTAAPPPSSGTLGTAQAIPLSAHPRLFYTMDEILALRSLISAGTFPDLNTAYNAIDTATAQLIPGSWPSTYPASSTHAQPTNAHNLNACISYLVDPTTTKANAMRNAINDMMNRYPNGRRGDHNYGMWHLSWAWMIDLLRAFHPGHYTTTEWSAVKEWARRCANVNNAARQLSSRSALLGHPEYNAATYDRTDAGKRVTFYTNWYNRASCPTGAMALVSGNQAQVDFYFQSWWPSFNHVLHKGQITSTFPPNGLNRFDAGMYVLATFPHGEVSDTWSREHYRHPQNDFDTVGNKGKYHEVTTHLTYLLAEMAYRNGMTGIFNLADDFVTSPYILLSQEFMWDHRNALDRHDGTTPTNFKLQAACSSWARYNTSKMNSWKSLIVSENSPQPENDVSREFSIIYRYPRRLIDHTQLVKL